jgi:hypothetical protein
MHEKNPKAGIYLHVLHDQARNFINLYVGQSLAIKRRISHHSSVVALARRIGNHSRRRSSHTNTKHIKCCALPGKLEFWLVFNEFNAAASKSHGNVVNSNREAAADFMRLLSLTELYVMLLFQTLPVAMLRAYLPRNAKVNCYPWSGLNKQNPLAQRRSKLENGSRNPVFPYWSVIKTPSRLLGSLV